LPIFLQLFDNVCRAASQILILIRDCIEEYEAKHGEIEEIRKKTK